MYRCSTVSGTIVIILLVVVSISPFAVRPCVRWMSITIHPSEKRHILASRPTCFQECSRLSHGIGTVAWNDRTEVDYLR